MGELYVAHDLVGEPLSTPDQVRGRPSPDHARHQRNCLMHVIHRRGWEIPEHRATPEGVFLNRRALLGAGAALRPRRFYPASRMRSA